MPLITCLSHPPFELRQQQRQYAEFGFSPSFFTVHTFFWGEEHMANLGPERASFISPMKSAIDKGLICSNHSDFSVTPMDPMRMTWSAVTRQSRGGKVIGPDERIDRWESLKALTINAAWQLREEDQKGTIAAGKLADLVILDANPLTVETDQILDIKAVETFIERFATALGEDIYRAKGFVYLQDDRERRYLYQKVGTRWSLEPGTPWGEEPRRTVVVMIALAGTSGAKAFDAFSGLSLAASPPV